MSEKKIYLYWELKAVAMKRQQLWLKMEGTFLAM